MKKTLIIISLFLLSACQTVSDMAEYLRGEDKEAQVSAKPLPYRFFIASFVDERDEATFVDSASYDFDQTLFLETIQKHLPYQIFGAADADLHIKLKEYHTTSFNKQYALSMALEMSAETHNGIKLAEKTMTCSQTTKESFELHNMLLDVIADPANIQLNSHKNKIWETLFTKCVNTTIRNFSRALVQRKTLNRRQ